MTNYKSLNHILPTVSKLVNSGLLSKTIIVYIAVYDYFYQLDGPKMDRYEKTAKEFNMSSKNCQRVVLLMNKNI